MPSGRQSLDSHGRAARPGHAPLQGRTKICPASSLDCPEAQRDPGDRDIPMAVASGRLEVLQPEWDRPERAPVAALWTGAHVQALGVVDVLPDAQFDDDLDGRGVSAGRVLALPIGDADADACDDGQDERAYRRDRTPQHGVVLHGAVPIHSGFSDPIEQRIDRAGSRVENPAVTFLSLLCIRPDRARIRGASLLVLGGGRDYFIRPPAIRRTADAYGAESRILPGVAHDIMLDTGWRQAAEAMLEWLQRTLGSGAR